MIWNNESNYNRVYCKDLIKMGSVRYQRIYKHIWQKQTDNQPWQKKKKPEKRRKDKQYIKHNMENSERLINTNSASRGDLICFERTRRSLSTMPHCMSFIFFHKLLIGLVYLFSSLSYYYWNRQWFLISAPEADPCMQYCQFTFTIWSEVAHNLNKSYCILNETWAIGCTIKNPHLT